MKLSFKKLSQINKKTRIILLCALVLIVTAAVLLTVFLIARAKAGNQIDKILVSTYPKLDYVVGEEADLTGLTLQVVRRNGKTENVSYAEHKDAITVSGFDTQKPCDDLKITLSYLDHQASFTVSVKKVPTIDPVLIGISMATLPKTTYKVGEWFEIDGGMILCEYHDGTTRQTVLLGSYISGWDEAYAGGVGTYTLTVKYKEKGVLQKTTFSVTITE